MYLKPERRGTQYQGAAAVLRDAGIARTPERSRSRIRVFTISVQVFGPRRSLSRSRVSTGSSMLQEGGRSTVCRPTHVRSASARSFAWCDVVCVPTLRTSESPCCAANSQGGRPLAPPHCGCELSSHYV